MMGCWNKTCMISNLHITAGQRVAVFLLAKKTDGYESFCYSSALYDHCPLPFYGEYNDYGSVENCNGIGLNYIVDAMREQLVELPQGDNPYHDIDAKKESFDIDKLFELDHEGRLLIEGNYHAKYPLEFLKESRGNLTQPQIESFEHFIEMQGVKALGRSVTHIQIHGDIFDHIIDNFKITDYFYNEKKKFTRFQFGFADIVASLPEYISRLRAKLVKINNEPETSMRLWLSRDIVRDLFKYEERNLAAKFLNFDSAEGSLRLLLHPTVLITAEAQKMNDTELTNLLVEFLKGAWINTFMSHTRRAWVKTTGEGGQDNSHVGHRVLIEAMTKVLDAEKAEFGEDDNE